MLSTRTVLIGLAFCLALVADSSAQSRGQTRKENPKTQQSAKPDQRGSQEHPLAVNVIPTAEQKADTEKKDREAAIKAADDHKSIEYAWYQILIGILTFCIFILQLVAFGLQARYMRRTVIEMRRTTHATIRSTRAAQSSANAAILNAEALIGAERARLFVIIDWNNLREALMGAHLHPTMVGSQLSPRPELSFFIKNTGRTAAILTEVSYQLIQRVDGAGWTHIAIDTIVDPVIEGGQRSAGSTPCPSESLLKIEDGIAAIDGSRPLFFYGYVLFRTVLKRNYKYFWRYQYRGQRFVLVYEKEHEEKQRDSP
jgi:hypothetical protein